MAASKFSGFPYIACDQPDVYETVGNHSAFEEALPPVQDVSQNENIDRSSINPASSYSAFKGKTLDSSVADLTDTVAPRVGKYGYLSISKEWESDGQGMPDESLQDRLERLKREIDALEKDYDALKKDESVSEKFLPHVDADFAKVVEDLKKRLSGVKVPSATVMDHGGGGDGPHVTPNKGSLRKNEYDESKVVAFENRIRKLEQALGSDRDLADLSRDSSTSLLATVTMLKNQMSLLDKDNLEQIESRMQTFLPRLTQALDKQAHMSAASDPEVEKKISEAYVLLKKWEETMRVLPSVVDRLVALKSVHQQAADLVKLQKETEELQRELLSKVTVMDGNIRLAEENFAQNMATIRKNMENLEKRVAK